MSGAKLLFRATGTFDEFLPSRTPFVCLYQQRTNMSQEEDEEGEMVQTSCRC
jgi:hypothetical protein